MKFNPETLKTKTFTSAVLTALSAILPAFGVDPEIAERITVVLASITAIFLRDGIQTTKDRVEEGNADTERVVHLVEDTDVPRSY